jgi:hypothetical protein
MGLAGLLAGNPRVVTFSDLTKQSAATGGTSLPFTAPDLLKINHLRVGTLDTRAESMLCESHGSAHSWPELAGQQIFKGAVGWKIL